jgi:DNA-binding NtrC family response regulator
MEPGKKRKILIVDDEELICWSLKQSFEKAGEYFVSCAYTGDDAIKKLNENDYDLVITDLKLPDVEDYDIVRKIRDLAADTPVIVISAHLSDPVMKDISKHGVYKCINKPFVIDDILGEVKEAVKNQEI